MLVAEMSKLLANTKYKFFIEAPIGIKEKMLTNRKQFLCRKQPISLCIFIKFFGERIK
jgi:hypothetical protein